MGDLYLTRLALTEFRTFSNCDIELPNGPGVLLVSGPNGLGKSTLFDALEWCLGGRVDRFGLAAKNVAATQYLRRWHARPDRTTAVSASFGSGETVRRGLDGGGERHEGLDPLTLLRASSWRAPIRDVHQYLLLTHFLGQSTLTRMTHRGAEDRWAFLKGPAQSDWAQDIGKALHGHGNSGEAQAYVTAQIRAQERAKRIEALLQAEATQFEGARAAGAIADDRVIEEAGVAIDRLIQGGQISLEEERPPLNAQSRLDRLAAAIEAIRAWMSARRTAVEQAGAVIDADARAQAALGHAQLVLQEVRDEVDIIRAAITAQGEVLERARQAEAADAAAVAGARQRVQALEDIRGKLAEKTDLSVRLAQLEALESDEVAALEAAELAVVWAGRRLRLGQRLETAGVEARRQAELAAARVQLLGDFAELDRVLDQHKQRLAQLQASSPDLDARLTVARRRAEAAAAAQRAAAQTLQRGRAAVETLSSAVAQVAQHITVETCDCPVCASSFPPGELLRRASRAAETLAPTLAPLQTLAEEADAEVAAVAASLQGLIAEEEIVKAARADLAFAEAERTEAAASLGGEVLDAPAAVLAETRRVERQRRRSEAMVNRLARLGSPAALQAEWSTALASRNAAEQRASARQAERTMASTRLRHLDEDIAAALPAVSLTMPLDEPRLAPDLTAANTTLQDLEAGYAAAMLAREQAGQKLEELRQSLSGPQAREAELKAEVERLRDEMTELATRWRRLGLAGPVAPASRAAAVAEIEEVQGRLGAAEERLGSLREGFSVGLRQTAHRQALAQLAQELETPAAQDREAIRRRAAEAQVEAAQRALSFLRAQEIAQAASDKVARQVEAFNRSYLRPINGLMERFNRAILTEPEVGLELEYRKNAVRQKTRRLSKAPVEVEKLDPLLVHSEGQMAALAVSMLCAASMTFGWSRWSALVLDDPLQHNDIVHASAFADLMRNLVRERGYQLFLSTHDVGQADFLRRKFVAGGVPCTTVRLRGMGDEGVDFEIAAYGAAPASRRPPLQGGSPA